jgi:hypothetical protein
VVRKTAPDDRLKIKAKNKKLMNKIMPEECRLLGCYAAWILKESAFWKKVAPPSSG